MRYILLRMWGSTDRLASSFARVRSWAESISTSSLVSVELQWFIPAEKPGLQLLCLFVLRGIAEPVQNIQNKTRKPKRIWGFPIIALQSQNRLRIKDGQILPCFAISVNFLVEKFGFWWKLPSPPKWQKMSDFFKTANTHTHKRWIKCQKLAFFKSNIFQNTTAHF